MDFAWDPAKAAGNIQKHQVSLEAAKSVFSDPLAVNFEDTEPSETEVREFMVGHSDRNRLSDPDTVSEELLPVYRFDYSKARPNRFAARMVASRQTIVLDPDVAAVFTTQ